MKKNLDEYTREEILLILELVMHNANSYCYGARKEIKENKSLNLTELKEYTAQFHIIMSITDPAHDISLSFVAPENAAFVAQSIKIYEKFNKNLKEKEANAKKTEAV